MTAIAKQEKFIYDDVLGSFTGYRGSQTLKGVGQEIPWTEELLIEWKKCKDSPIYFGEHYMKAVHVDRGLIDIDLYDYQKEIIESAVENRRTVAECARQSGKTTAVTVFALWMILFHKHYKIAILANKGGTAREILARIKLAYEQLPDWLQQGVVEWNKGFVQIENGSQIMASATSADNIRGFTCNMLFIDEVAAIDNWDEFYTSVYPTISSGKTTKIVLVSTVNGLNHFHNITSQARQGKNGFNLISVSWQDVPGRDEEWKQETLQGMNNDLERFQQEFENRYLGSSGTLIAGSHLSRLFEERAIVEAENVKIYENPVKNRVYVCVADVSRGKGLDYSAFQMIDVTEMPYKQVAAFRDNFLSPAEFAEILYRMGKHYNEAGMLVEINDIGQQVAEMLYYDYEYDHLLFTDSHGMKGKKITTGMRTNTDKGIRTTKTVKNVGCSILKLLIEQYQLELKDKDTIDELKTFAKKGQSYEAEPGKHDDLVMCLVLFAWLSEQTYFKSLTDINTLMKLRENTEEQLEQELLPLGFNDTGDPNSRIADQLELKKHKGERWEVVNDYIDVGEIW